METIAVLCAFGAVAVLGTLAGDWLGDEVVRWLGMRKHAVVTEYPPPTGAPDTSIEPPKGC